MTAVEWLTDKFYANEGIMKSEWLDQAKELEKEQIMDAYKADLYPCSDEDAEQYYNETFKSE